MKLVEPSLKYERQILAYRQEMLASGSSMDGCCFLGNYERVKDWLDNVEALKRLETTPSNLVPSTQYIYVREVDDKVVGMIQIRHCFNAFLEKYGGHIGYSVAPGERRKGYATQMLNMILPKCRELGLSRILITCIQGNEASRRTILKNGGVYESTGFEPNQSLYLERYWIEIL